MSDAPPAAGGPEPVLIIQPCSEACACFRALPRGYEWQDYGICTNPRSQFHGFPVRIGRDCRNYQPNKDPDRHV